DADADPHADQPVVTAGAPASVADAVVVALHGRGATAQGVVNLADPLYRHGVTFVAPQAARSRWFPYAAGAPIQRNEPHVSSALSAVDRVLADVADWGVPVEDVVLFGFSQGASLAAEYAARNPRRYGGVVVLSGGLLGPLDHAREYEGSMDGAPVFLGCGADDPHVSGERVRETAAVFRDLDADVTERIYDGVGHEVTDEEFAFAGGLLDEILESGA
ncbi:MAG: alpha/beta hydrolase, partial [Halobacterium sp.]